MRRFDPRLWLGVLLIAGGVLILLQNLGVLDRGLDWLWAAVMALVGAGFLATFFGDRAHGWALIPGLIFLDFALLIGLGAAAPRLASRWGGPIFLLGLSLPFWLVYLADRGQWWGLIPGGVLATLGVVAGLGAFEWSGVASAGVFFLGLGVTFVIVWLAPTPHGRMRWALYPAVPLLILGALLATPFATLADFVLPAFFILLGVFVLWRAFRPRAS